MRKILITGGAGFIGLHLARHLLSEGDNQIILVDNFDRAVLDNDLACLLESPSVELRKLDLTDPQSLNDLDPRVDEIYHLAAVVGVGIVRENPQEVIRVNALATLTVLEWISKNKFNGRLLFASTSEAYAWTQHFHELPIPTPETVPLAITDLKNPRASYAGSKIFGELAVSQYGEKFKFPYSIVRFHNVYGPRMGYDHVIPQLYGRMTSGATEVVVFSPTHQRAFCFVEDAVRLMPLIMRHRDANGQVFNIGNDREEVTILELARMIRDIGGSPVNLTEQDIDYDPIKRRCPSMEKARAYFDYAPDVNLKSGLMRTLAWYAGQTQLRK